MTEAAFRTTQPQQNCSVDRLPSGFSRLVFATGGVQTVFPQTQPFHWTTTDDVRLDDFFDVISGDPAVPHAVGVDHDIGAVLALIEASRLVCTNSAFQAALRQFLLEEFL